jgi:hypothetical protein
MAYPGVANASNSNAFPATILAVYVNGGSAKWQTLGEIAEGSELNLEFFTNLDSKRRDRSQGASHFTAKFRMTQSSSVELKLLDSLTDGTQNFLFKCIDAGAIPANAAVTVGWFAVSSTQVMGVHAQAKFDGDEQSFGYIDIELSGSLLTSEIDAAVKPSIATAQFEATGDTGIFHAIGTYTAALDGGLPTPSHKKPCGVASITLADHAGGSPQTIYPIYNVKIGFDFPVLTEGARRYPLNTVNIAIEFEWGSTQTDLLLLDSIAPLAVDAVITMRNAEVFTLSDQTGNKIKYSNVGTMDKLRFSLYTLNGTILKSDFDGTVG